MPLALQFEEVRAESGVRGGEGPAQQLLVASVFWRQPVPVHECLPLVNLRPRMFDP